MTYKNKELESQTLEISMQILSHPTENVIDNCDYHMKYENVLNKKKLFSYLQVKFQRKTLSVFFFEVVNFMRCLCNTFSIFNRLNIIKW